MDVGWTVRLHIQQEIGHTMGQTDKTDETPAESVDHVNILAEDACCKPILRLVGTLQNLRAVNIKCLRHPSKAQNHVKVTTTGQAVAYCISSQRACS